jgi:drug/metabolite transporter (DMT)-like permease
LEPNVKTHEMRGLLWGLLGVIAFSLTLPATRAAVPSLGVAFVFLGRVAGAGLAAALILLVVRQPLPRRQDWLGLVVTSLGVVIGFPFLTTLALACVPASHGAIVVGLLPISTAVAGVVLAGERPSSSFWFASAAATAIVLAFILQSTDGRLGLPDVALIGAVVAAACGYAKGGQLAGRLGSWQVICWSLVIALPITAPATLFFVTVPQQPVSASAWIAFAYVMLVSQLTGFFAWYYGLALGGIARVSQMQLLQLFFTLAASAWLLGETIDGRILIYGVAVVVAVAIGARARIARAPASGPHA